MQVNHRRILYTARRGRLHSAGWEFTLTMAIAVCVCTLFLVVLGYMSAADAAALALTK